MNLRRVLLCGLALLWAGAAHGQFVIAEFMASNATGLRDEDGATPDWIELHNNSPEVANLGGWFLTDTRLALTKWQFPATNVAANGRLVVFASGKDRAVPGASLHTNFRIEAGGGYLALLQPDGRTVAGSFLYPTQFPDISYGTGPGPSGDTEALLVAGATMRYWIPAASVSDTWRGGAEFDDSAWSSGVWPAGYDVSTGAVTVACSTPANTAGNQEFGGSLGMDFVVMRSVQVTALGCFDDRANGIAAGTTVTVELWQRNDRGTPGIPADDTGAAVLAKHTFTSTSPGTPRAGNRFKPLAAPVVLTNGAYTIVAYGYNRDERNGNTGGDFPALALDGGGALEFVRSRCGAAGAFPSTVDVKVAQYGAGTFEFQTLPASRFATGLVAMRKANASVLARAPFTVTDPAGLAGLLLTVTCDDGFVAWLNGVEVARRNAPATLEFDSTATRDDSATVALDVSAFLAALRAGTNVLAIHGLNVSADDVDFGLEASLAAERMSTNAVYFLAPTPGGANTAGLLFPRIVIDEIHCDPPNSKTVPAEFIELHNPLSVAVDLSGWTFTRGVHLTFGPGTIVPPRGYIVVAEDPETLEQTFGVAGIGPWIGSLANAGETIELTDGQGSVVDSVSYETGFPWPTVGDAPGASLQLLNAGLDRNLGGAWRSAPPTPAARNLIATSRVPPQIRQVEHAPRQPASGQEVTITAKVTDPEGVRGVSIEYQIVEPGAYVRLSDPAFGAHWISLPMQDAGEEGDTVAGDSVYTVRLPATVSVHRRLIRYRIAATDAAGNGIRVPYEDDPSPNFACFVYDGVPAPKTAYLQLRVVDDALEASPASQFEGDLWGLYLGFEEYDEQFKDEHGLGDGSLFLLQGGNNRLAAQGAGQPDDLSDLNAFIAGYNAAPTPALAWWRSHVDLAAYYTWRAVTEAVNNTDIREQENVAYFRSLTRGLWSIHPWDSDLLYEQFDRWGPQGVQTQAPYEQIRRCLELEDLRVEFENRARELEDLLLNHDQTGKLIDECAALVTDAGPASPGFVEVDRRLWDWNPRTTAVNTDQPKGQFYRTPFPVPNFGFGPIGYRRVLASADFAGQVAWVKDFIIAYPGVAGDAADRPWRYEIEASWTSGELATGADRIAIPALVARPGHTYRARVRMKDTGGRWSHWSAPIQFAAGAPVLVRLAEDLVVSEIMYDPPDFAGVDGSAFEFLELRNVGATTLDLGGLAFTDGIDFTFPSGTLLPAGGFFLLARGAWRSSTPAWRCMGFTLADSTMRERP